MLQLVHSPWRMPQTVNTYPLCSFHLVMTLFVSLPSLHISLMEDIDRQVVVLEKTGVRLCLSQETIATAITYFNKFKEYGPFSSFRTVESASACLFLATKVHDEIRKIRDILNCWKEADGENVDIELTKEWIRVCVLTGRYYHLKERIVECEQVILRTFVFDVDTTHPFVWTCPVYP